MPPPRPIFVKKSVQFMAWWLCIDLKPANALEAWSGVDFKSVRDEPRFQELTGQKPKPEQAEQTGRENPSDPNAEKQTEKPDNKATGPDAG